MGKEIYAILLALFLSQEALARSSHRFCISLSYYLKLAIGLELSKYPL